MLSAAAPPSGGRNHGRRDNGARVYGALAVGGCLAALVAYFVWRQPPGAGANSASARTQASHAREREDARAERPAEPAKRPTRTRAEKQPATPSPSADVPLSSAQASDPAVQAVLAARLDDSPRGTKTLIANLTSKDDVVVAEAAGGLIARGATEAIEPLAKIDLPTAAGSGLSIIDALGKLSGLADADERKVAVDRLIEMLAEEKRRGAPESPGNLLQIYEALGETHDPRAATALEAELVDPTVPRAPKVVIVQSLVKLAEPSSHAVLETALATERAAKESDAFEEEIRLELVGAIEEALKVI